MIQEVAQFGINKGLMGIIARPDTGADKSLPAIIMLNAGLTHRIGPNRLHVKMARAFEELGFTSFRFDLSGIGDSKNSTLNLDFRSNGVQNVKEAMDFLSAGKGVNRFIILGICSGADIAFQAAVEDERVIAVIPINAYYFDLAWTDPLLARGSKACSMRYYRKSALNVKRWLKLFTGQSKAFNRKNVSIFFNLVSKRLTKRKSLQQGAGPQDKEESPERYSIKNWERLMDRKVSMLQLFSEGSNSYDVYHMTVAHKLSGFIQQGFIDYKMLNDIDHIFTPEWSHRQLISVITHWISGKRELGVLTSSENPGKLENKKIEDLLTLNI